MILNMLQQKLIKQIVVPIIIKNRLRPPLPPPTLHTPVQVLHILQTNLGSYFNMYSICICICICYMLRIQAIIVNIQE